PNDLAIQEAPWICVNYVVPNTKKKPFDDVRVRQALTLAIDRYAGSSSLSKITIVRDVGGLMRPKGPFAQADTDLQKIAGFGTDGAAAKEQAKKLLADAGVPNLTFKFLNRNIQTPYEPVALFAIDQAKRKTLVAGIEKYAMDTKAYQYPVLWWYRIIPYLNVVRGWRIGSNHYTNQDLATVWLASK